MDTINMMKDIRFPLRPRIRLTSFCNRKCSYCFAQDYLHLSKNEREISLEDIEALLSLCRDSGIPMVAWQGGEPLLHTNMLQIIELHRSYGIEAMVFTNALVDPRIIESLKGIVKHVLVNCNERCTYSVDEWDLLEKNIKNFIQVIGKRGVALSYNIYDENMDTDFICDMAYKCGVEEVRIDMTRPAPSHENTHITLPHISTMFLKLKKILLQLIEKGIKRPHLDCPFPLCELSESDCRFVEKYIYDGIKYGSCYTGIDFSTNLSIQSCFCAPVLKNISINQFDSIWHAWLSIEHLENKLRWANVSKEECRNCEYHLRHICQGGCLGYKSNDFGEIDYKKLIDFQKDLPDQYIQLLAKAYQLFYTNQTDQCLIILDNLPEVKNFERTYWLHAITNVAKGHYAKAMEIFKILITITSYPAVYALDAAIVFKNIGQNNYSLSIMEFSEPICRNDDSHYKRLLYGLIEMNKTTKQFSNIPQYIKKLSMIS